MRPGDDPFRAGGMVDRILEQIGDQLPDQVSIAAEPDAPAARLCGQLLAVLLGDRLIDLHQLGHELGQIDRLALDRRSFELRDPQDAVERLDQAIDRAGGIRQNLVRRGLPITSCGLDPMAGTGQRRAQIVGDVEGDLAHPIHGLRQAIEQDIERSADPVELVAFAAQPDAGLQIVLHPVDVALDLCDPAPDPQRQQAGHGERRADRHRQRDQEGRKDAGAGAGKLGGAPADGEVDVAKHLAEQADRPGPCGTLDLDLEPAINTLAAAISLVHDLELRGRKQVEQVELIDACRVLQAEADHASRFTHTTASDQACQLGKFRIDLAIDLRQDSIVDAAVREQQGGAREDCGKSPKNEPQPNEPTLKNINQMHY
jgi:hypothetical protein